jgi:LemA protein
MDALFNGVATLAIVAAGLYLWYATIVSRRNKANEAWSSVDVHLQQRLDLIPNILTIADRFMDHERQLLTEVTSLRAMAGGLLGQGAEVMRERLALEDRLGQAVGRLLVTLEAYPELRSDATMLEAQRTWTEVEGQITAARRFYNAAVNQLNNAVQIFPGNLLAVLAEVRPMPFFEASRQAREAPRADLLLARRSRDA